MSRFRRATVGSTFFFTVVSHRRRPILCSDPVRFALRTAIDHVRIARPFDVEGIVLLPDHLHCIWTLPDDDVGFSARWSLIKHHVAYACRGLFDDVSVTASRRKHRDANVWQRRFWEHQIRSDADLERHLDYIHFNPVKHGIAKSAGSWPYSSFHRYVAKGVYPLDWAGVPSLQNMDLD